MNEPNSQLPPEIDFSSFDYTNLTNSFLSDEILSQSTGEKYLVFFLNENLYAVSTAQVAEVTSPLPITPLPNAPDWLIGIANLRNEIISVVCLAKILKTQNSAAPPKSKLVVLRAPDATSRIAFTVDRLSEIISLRDAEIRFQTNANSPYVVGKAVHLSNHLSLIDAEKILPSLIV